MAQYKVPQDVEADDKLIGPFSFRQFVYLMIAAGLVALCIPLFNVFPLLIILPAPFILFLLALSLPLKKDQPMETYLSAILSYYMKPHNRLWEPGEPESTIVITAPKKSDEIHLKDINQDEAMHRLSFLADIVDTEGYAIKGSNNGVREDILAEANSAHDIFDVSSNSAFAQQTYQQTANTQHQEMVNQMKAAIAANNNQPSGAAIISHNGQQPHAEAAPAPITPTPAPITPPITQPQFANYASAEPVVPVAPVTPLPQLQSAPVAPQPVATTPPPQFVTDAMQPAPAPVAPTPAPEPVAQPIAPANPFDAQAATPDLPTPENIPQSQPIMGADAIPQLDFGTPSEQPAPPSQDIINLANNADYSIETIAEQAKRINDKQDSEVYVSLH